MRLDRFIANNSDFSRKDVTRLIKQKRVTVNAAMSTVAGLQLNAEDLVAIDHEPIYRRSHAYVMLNKPAGSVCANQDADHPTVIDLLRDSPFPAKDLQIAGRLDIDTTGLVLLTTDGDWNHRITAPSASCSKEYRVETAEPISNEAIARIEQGILLKNETKPTLPAKIELISSTVALLHISEGRYHQVKRMFAACNNRVTQLHRLRIGKITLDPSLQPGEFRSLTPAEHNFS